MAEQDDAARFEALAQKLKADGYRAGVVAQKLVQVHHMPQVDAEALVGRLFGTSVTVGGGGRKGEIVSGFLVFAIFSLCTVMLHWQIEELDWGLRRGDPLGYLQGVCAVLAFIGLVRGARALVFSTMDASVRK